MVATQEPTKDPLLNPPDWYRLVSSAGIELFGHPMVFEHVDNTQIVMGPINGYPVSLWHYKSGETCLYWGCRQIISEAQGRYHWLEGVSTISNQKRPHATRLLDWVRDICAYHKWVW